MFNWRALLGGAICFGTAPTFTFAFVAIAVGSIFLPRKFFYVADSWIYDHYQRMVLFFYHSLSGSRLVLYGDVDALRKGDENVLYLSNHQTALDWVITDMLAAVQGNIGKTRYVLKDQIRMLPLYGFYFRARGCVYVKRGRTKREGAFDEAYAVRQLDRLRTDKVPLWLVIFPEGTRFNPSKQKELERSKEFARSNGLTVCDEVLTPRSKAVYLSLRSLSSHLDAVYDFTIGFSSTVPKLGAASQTRVGAPGMLDYFARPTDIHVHIRRIPISEIPDANLGEEVIRKWLHERFVEKEQ